MSKNKIIGIPGYRYEKSSFGAGLNHLEYISNFGKPRIIMPWEEFVEVDLLYLPGGLDIRPDTYGEVPGFNTSNQDVFKQHFFDHNLKNYVEKQVPIFGVCLGAQELAVYFGSKLVQDLKFHPQSSGRWSTAHKVTVLPQDTSKSKTKPISFEVNSHHHQCITNLTLNHRELTPLCGTKGEDKDPSNFIVEAFKHNKLPIIGVQWHPEELYDDYSTSCFNTLLGN